MALTENCNRLEREKKLLMDTINSGEKTYKSRQMANIFSGNDQTPFMIDEIFKHQERKFNIGQIPKLECNQTDLQEYERWEKKLIATITGFGIEYLMRKDVIQAYLE